MRVSPKQFPEFGASQEFGVLVEFVRSAGIEVKAPQTAVVWNRFCFDALAWRPSHFALSAAQAASPFEIYHHGFHYLLATHYTPELFQRPRFTLMAEALVSQLEVFFAIQHLETDGPRHPSVKRLLAMCKMGGNLQPKKIIAFLRHHRRQPFVAYREVSLEVFGLCELLLGWCSTASPSRAQLRRFRDGVANLRYRFLYEQLMFEIYLLFVLGQCTAKSCAGDVRDTRDLRRRLERADSMLELLTGLGSTTGN